MGLYSAPLAYAGYHPDVTGPATVVNSTVRAATQEEVNAGTLDYVYVSPATLIAGIVTDLSSPPPIGNVTPNTVAATTFTGDYADLAHDLTSDGVNTAILVSTDYSLLSIDATSAGASIADGPNSVPVTVTILCGNGSSGNAILQMGNNPKTTQIEIGNAATTGGFRTTIINGGSQTQDDTVRMMVGAHSAGTQTFNLLTGIHTGGTQRINIFTGASSGTQIFNLFTGAAASSTANLCTAFAASTLNLGNGNTGSSVNVGNLYFANANSVSGATVIINSQRSGQCVFSDIIAAGTTVNLFLSSSFVSTSSVFIASVSCADTSPAVLLNITRINPGVGSVAFRVTNSGASDTVTPISINFLQII